MRFYFYESGRDDRPTQQAVLSSIAGCSAPGIRVLLCLDLGGAGGDERVMPQPRASGPREPVLLHKLCANCHSVMLLVLIQPEDDGAETFTFKCQGCGRFDVDVVKFDSSAPAGTPRGKS